jgi:hypothetical protein
MSSVSVIKTSYQPSAISHQPSGKAPYYLSEWHYVSEWRINAAEGVPSEGFPDS